MGLRYLVWLLIAVPALLASPVSAGIAECAADYVSTHFTRPREVVEAFLDAVDRGELKVFGRVLDRSMVTPIQVEYVYDLDCPTPSISVYSKLTLPISMPQQGNCEARAISAAMSADGHIVETEVHVWIESGGCVK